MCVILYCINVNIMNNKLIKTYIFVFVIHSIFLLYRHNNLTAKQSLKKCLLHCLFRLLAS